MYSLRSNPEFQYLFSLEHQPELHFDSLPEPQEVLNYMLDGHLLKEAAAHFHVHRSTVVTLLRKKNIEMATFPPEECYHTTPGETLIRYFAQNLRCDFCPNGEFLVDDLPLIT